MNICGINLLNEWMNSSVTCPMCKYYVLSKQLLLGLRIWAIDFIVEWA